MNHKIATILKGYIEDLSWADKVAGLTQVANIRLKEGENKTDKSYPISCDIDADACLKGKYQDLAPDQKKKSVMFFEDRGGVTLEKHEGNRLFYQCQLRLVVWLNIRLIEGVACDADASCGVSGDYVIDVIKAMPYHPFTVNGFYGIFIEPPEQVERSVDIFSRYTFNEPQTQYLMHPFDYFALDYTIHFAVPCDYTAVVPAAPVALAADVLCDGFTAKLTLVAKAEGYYMDVSTDTAFTSIVPGYDSLDIGHADEYLVTGLISGTYYYRFRAYNDTGESGNSNVITAIVPLCDWYLPSLDETDLFRTVLFDFGVGGFDPDIMYWSSTEDPNSGNQAYLISMFTGFAIFQKNLTFGVRAIRSFTSTTVYALRDIGPAGGWIIYKNGNDYLECAPSDQSDGYVWSNIITEIGVTAQGTAIGTGQANTTAIIGQAGHVTSAAKLCNDLEV